MFNAKKMNGLLVGTMGIIVIFMSSCAEVYRTPDVHALSYQHENIAIIPPTVSIAARKNIDAEAMKEQQRTESANFQREMQNWLLKRKMQRKIFVDIQDVETTNVKLRKAGYFDAQAMSPKELCDLLGVDAVIFSNYALSKPRIGGTIVPWFGGTSALWGSTNETTATIQLHDKQAEKIIWNYSDRVSGRVGSSPARLVDNLMRNASKKMPYSKYKRPAV